MFNPKLRGRSISLAYWKWGCGPIAIASCCLFPKHRDWGTANSLWSGLADRIIVGLCVICPDPFIQIWTRDFIAGQKMSQSGALLVDVLLSNEEERMPQRWSLLVLLQLCSSNMSPIRGLYKLVLSGYNKLVLANTGIYLVYEPHSRWCISKKSVSKDVASSDALCAHDGVFFRNSALAQSGFH